MRFALASTLPFVALSLLISCAPTPPPPPSHAPVQVDPAVIETYRTWVGTQADLFLTRTEAFVSAVMAGNRDLAQALYADARTPYERIEPIAEALGDLDHHLDAREGDVPAAEWRGYHKLEKLLWSSADLKEGASVAQTLLADARLLRARIETAQITVPGLVTGAVELLNEVSTSKATGEEDRYSHTDLWDFQANLEGSEQIWNVLAPSVRTADVALGRTIDARFSYLHGLLEVHRKGDGFRPYNQVLPKEVKMLSAAVDALAEPLAQMGRLLPE